MIVPFGGGSYSISIPYQTAGGHYYKLTATPAAGYVFDHFEWDEVITYDYDPFNPRIQGRSSSSNPTSYPKTPRTVDIDYGPPYGVAHITFENISAYFTYVGPGPGPGPGPEPETYTVAISADPEGGGNVSGGGEYNKGAICTLTAERVEGYELMSLEGLTTVYPPNPPQCFGKTITYSFVVNSDSSWVAHFRECTNKILRGSSGKILRGSGGNILRDY